MAVNYTVTSFITLATGQMFANRASLWGSTRYIGIVLQFVMVQEPLINLCDVISFSPKLPEQSYSAQAFIAWHL